jgi:hypothetical protein
MTRRQRLEDIVRSTSWLMRALEAVQSADVPNAYVGAGAVRATVWDALHGFPARSAVADVDVPYFDPSDLSAEREEAYRAGVAALAPDFLWDVVNQASVHLWYGREFGTAIAPLRSVEEGIASWPETATAVALSLDHVGEIQVVAPYGLSDLFNCVVRRSPRCVGLNHFKTRVEAKRYSERWPRVRVVLA